MTKLHTDSNNYYVFRQDLLTGKYHSPISGWIRRDPAAAIAANRLCASPHIIARRSTIDRIAIKVTALAAGSHCRLGIYDSDGVYPKNLVLDAGEIDSSTTGFKAIVIDRQLNPGLYWFAVVSDGTPALHFLDNSYDQGAVVLGLEGDGSSMYLNATSVYRSFTYGALPNPFGTPSESRNYAFNILYRLASLD